MEAGGQHLGLWPYARGYKAGGYNLERSDLTPNVYAALTAASVTNLRFDPETVNAYELGVKFTSRTFTLNAAAFRSNSRTSS